jgi:hypothetical protein
MADFIVDLRCAARAVSGARLQDVLVARSF